MDLESPERQNVQNARELATAVRRQADVQAGDAEGASDWKQQLTLMPTTPMIVRFVQ